MNDLPQLPERAQARIRQRIDAGLNRTRQPSWRRGVVLGAATALLLGTGATGMAFAATTSNQPTVSYCYAHASMTSRSVEVSITPMKGTTPSANRFAVAIDNCAGAWLDGAFAKNHRPIDASQAPSLIVCERADHAAASFPDSSGGQISTEKFCTRLGLRNPIN
jgi:hypothetical protein